MTLAPTASLVQPSADEERAAVGIRGVHGSEGGPRGGAHVALHR